MTDVVTGVVTAAALQDDRAGAPAPDGNRPLVSFFVPTYNQEEFVRDAVASAFAQTWTPLEIILSDDASSDTTFAIMQEMAAAYDGPHKVVLNRNPENLGITPHMDRLMALSHGELVVDNPGDDISLPERVEKIVAAWLASGRRIKAIHSARRRLDRDGKLHEVIDDRRVLAHMTPLEVIRDHGTLVGASLGWARELHEVFGPQSPVAIFDDFPTCFRAALLGDIHYIAEPLLHYRMGGVSSRPQEDFGENYLHGFRIRNLRWHRAFWKCYLRDMAVVTPPDAAECRRLCEVKISRANFQINLAETPWHKLPLVLPGNLIRSLREGNGLYLRETLKYIFGPLYRPWRDIMGRRQRARRRRRARSVR